MRFRFSSRIPVKVKVLWTCAAGCLSLSAADLTVVSSADSGAGTLRQAVLDAAPGDRILFDPVLDGQTITLTSGHILIDKDLTIEGPGADILTVSGGGLSRIFDTAAGIVGSIGDLTLTGGHSGGGNGGGLANLADLTLERVHLSNCHATGSGAGGGISNQPGATLTVRHSSISGCSSALGGGGIANLGPGTSLTLLNSTLSGNHAGTHGGGAANTDGQAWRVDQCTITGNSANSRGGGLWLFGTAGSLSLSNTLAAENTAGQGGPDVWAERFLSLDHNLIGDSAGITFVPGNSFLPGDLIGVDPRLGPLAGNGGCTPTHALHGGSPAIDGGKNATNLAGSFDQRGAGFPRILDGDDDGTATLDIGAFEVPYNAQTFVVDTRVDEDDGVAAGNVSLRDALNEANRNVGDDTIEFHPSIQGESILATGSGFPVITDDLHLDGPGADLMTVNAGGTSSVLGVNPGATVTISGLTLAGGLTGGNGGGIFNRGTLTLRGVHIRNNSCSGAGGGISNEPGGVLRILDSAVTDNISSFGGGGALNHLGARIAQLENSTFSGNRAGTHGGGLANTDSTSWTMKQCTFSANFAPNDGGGMFTIRGAVSLENNLFSGNSVGGRSPEARNEHGSSLGHNLIRDAAGVGFPPLPSDQFGTQAVPIDGLLGPLADNGGPTPTHALLAGSPAVDAGNNAAIGGASDQRGAGFPRIIDGNDDGTATVDIGAFEAPPVNRPPTLDIIPDLAIDRDSGEHTVPLTGIGPGAAHETQTLGVSALCDNAELITGLAIDYTSPDSTGSVRFTPAAGLFGTATITVTVDDGDVLNNTTSRSFLVTVNDLQSASIAAWQELTFGGGAVPAARIYHRTVYDTANNRLILFGGASGNINGTPTLHNDVWVLAHADGTTGSPAWMQLAPTGTPPSSRAKHSIVYDAGNNRMILFGGNPNVGNCFVDLNDTWVLTNANGLGGAPQWIQLAPGGPLPGVRANHVAAYNVSSNRLIVFGGNNECAARQNDVWVLSNANGLGGAPGWQELAIAPPLPDGRSDLAAGYNASTNKLVVHAGFGTSSLADAWVLANADGTGGPPAWTILAPSGPLPAARFLHAGDLDAGRDELWIHGGLGAPHFSDIWRLKSATAGASPAWEELSPAGPAPPARDSHSLSFRSSSRRMVIFGGRRCDPGCVALGDTWVLDTGSPGAQSWPAWQADSFPPGTPPADMLPDANPDHDLFTNKIERFLGTDPLSADGSPFEFVLEGNVGKFRFPRSRTAPFADGIVEWSLDLLTYFRTGVTLEVISDLGAGRDLIEARFTLSAPLARFFAHLGVPAP